MSQILKKKEKEKMSFEKFELDAKILAGVQACGYNVPTPIQLQSIPPIMEGRDVMGLAQTGTGKTAAFVLPILQRLMQGTRSCPRADYCPDSRVERANPYGHYATGTKNQIA